MLFSQNPVRVVHCEAQDRPAVEDLVLPSSLPGGRWKKEVGARGVAPGTSQVLGPDSSFLPQFGVTALAGPNPAYFSRRPGDSWEAQALPTATFSLPSMLSSHKGHHRLGTGSVQPKGPAPSQRNAAAPPSLESEKQYGWLLCPCRYSILNPTLPTNLPLTPSSPEHSHSLPSGRAVAREAESQLSVCFETVSLDEPGWL